MNYSLNVKSSSIVHTLLSNCVKLLGKVQKLLIKCISYSIISMRSRVVSPKFYTARKNFTRPPVPTVPTNFKSATDTTILKLNLVQKGPKKTAILAFILMAVGDQYQSKEANTYRSEDPQSSATCVPFPF